VSRRREHHITRIRINASKESEENSTKANENRPQKKCRRFLFFALFYEIAGARLAAKIVAVAPTQNSRNLGDKIAADKDASKTTDKYHAEPAKIFFVGN
jgi:hypothetical protein